MKVSIDTDFVLKWIYILLVYYLIELSDYFSCLLLFWLFKANYHLETELGWKYLGYLWYRGISLSIGPYWKRRCSGNLMISTFRIPSPILIFKSNFVANFYYNAVLGWKYFCFQELSRTFRIAPSFLLSRIAPIDLLLSLEIMIFWAFFIFSFLTSLSLFAIFSPFSLSSHSSLSSIFSPSSYLSYLSLFFCAWLFDLSHLSLIGFSRLLPSFTGWFADLQFWRGQASRRYCFYLIFIPQALRYGQS